MFNQTFLAGAIVIAITCAAALGVSQVTGLNPTISLVGFAALAWGYFFWLERRTRPDPADVPVPIRVDWDEKLNDTDFGAGSELTRTGLADLGLTAESALGKELIFATENAESKDEIYFEGTFVRTADGGIVIRSTEPV